MTTRRKVVIFGTNKVAACALAFFRADGIADVTAFTVDSHRVESTTFCGLPVVPYEDLRGRLSPKGHHIFVAVGYSDINRNRQAVMKRVQSDGYRLSSCVSPRATIMPGSSIGINAFIFHDCTIDPYVTIGDGVLIGSNTTIGHHSIVEDYTYLTYGTVIAGSARIGHHSIIGCNATIGASTTIGPFNIIGDGAVVCSSTQPNSVYVPPQTPKAPLSSERVKTMMLEPLSVRSTKHRNGRK